jgi:hypothetical protein
MTEDALEARDYTFCVATYTDPLTWRRFLVGTPSRPAARERAMAFAVARWGEPESISCYPRNYIREARALFAAGMHDGDQRTRR